MTNKLNITKIVLKNIVSFLFVVLLFSSCSEYQKALKTEDVSVKFEVSTKLYEAQKYSKAIRIFEQLAPTYRGKPQAEKLFYMFSMSYYKTEQFYLAAYQFESFVSGYPKSEKLEEASFLGAKCFSKLSPSFSLDQVDTFKAIEKLQDFINRYPNSTYIAEANVTLKGLNDKIEKKVFENAKQYNTITEHKAAIVALDNFVEDFPGTIYKEEALFVKYDSAYQLAINSVPDKMEERLHVAQTAYNSLIKFKPETKYKKIADEMSAQVETNLKKYNK